MPYIVIDVWIHPRLTQEKHELTDITNIFYAKCQKLLLTFSLKGKEKHKQLSSITWSVVMSQAIVLR